MRGFSPRLILGIIITVVLILGLAFLISFLSVSFMRAQNLKFFSEFTDGVRRAATKNRVSMGGLEFVGDNRLQYHILFIDENTAEDLQDFCGMDRYSIFTLEKCKQYGCVCLFEHEPTFSQQLPFQVLDVCVGSVLSGCGSTVSIPMIDLDWIINNVGQTVGWSIEKPTFYYTTTKDGIFTKTNAILQKICNSGERIKVLDCKQLSSIGLIDENGEFRPIVMKVVVSNTIQDRYLAGMSTMNGKLVIKYWLIERPYDEAQGIYLDSLYITNISTSVS